LPPLRRGGTTHAECRLPRWRKPWSGGPGDGIPTPLSVARSRTAYTGRRAARRGVLWFGGAIRRPPANRLVTLPRYATRALRGDSSRRGRRICATPVRSPQENVSWRLKERSPSPVRRDGEDPAPPLLGGRSGRRRVANSRGGRRSRAGGGAGRRATTPSVVRCASAENSAAPCGSAPRGGFEPPTY